MTTFQATDGYLSSLTRGVERRASLDRQAAPQAPGRTRESVVRDRGEARLVGAQRQQQVRDAIRRRQVAIGDPYAVAMHAPAAGADEQRPGLAHQPYAEPAALQGEPGRALQVTLAVPQQVAEQALCHLLRAAVGPRLAAHHVRAAEGVQLRDDPGVREARERNRER